MGSSAAPGNDGFARIINTDLRTLAVVNQCLDNQWVPRRMLGTMLEKGRGLDHRRVAGPRLRQVRQEWLRSLLNAEQVVVNRAFFLNNPAVYQDYLEDGPAAAAFRALLADSVIVPFLFAETGPAQQQDFGVQAAGRDAWHRVVREVRETGGGSCLRISWDDDENRRLTRKYLAAPFHDLLLSLARFDEQGLAGDFGLDRETAAQLKRQLREIAQWAVWQERVTREEFYKKFVVAEGSNPADGRYDRHKPFAGVVKQLADLQYNTGLADAVNAFPLTPADSLGRTALQELTRTAAERDGGLTEISGDRLVELFRQYAFQLVQQPLAIGLTGLALDHVRQARGTDEWLRYTAGMRRLVAAPLEFPVHAQTVYADYAALAGRLSDIVAHRREGVAERWQPIVKWTVEVLGASLSLFFDDNPHLELLGDVAESVAGRASDAVVRFAVVGRDRRRAGAELETSVDLMRVKFERTGEQWRELTARLAEQGLPVHRPDRRPPGDANLNEPGSR
ncbi:hypothetical protein [Streptomyces aidingensis]|uniref:Uncharacterized protein n=1 Tax=Streptomyces aidingensis TaxID=910347 RepID=A0A1I1QCR1_9ACTN|nr:hypothetical protein [Streptomyces aidingensis]SFD17013.1 hypothetical protein SAMN05421773_110265 [Streptomyces aidingensis]